MRRVLLFALFCLALAGLLDSGARAAVTVLPNGNIRLAYTVEPAVAQRIVDAYCWAFNYQAQVPNGIGGTVANPETRRDFADRMILESIRDTVQRYEVSHAQETAAATERAKPRITVQ